MSSYQSAKQKHADAKSSAWAFLIVGAVGFAVCTLALLGILSLPLGGYSLAVMDILFILFLAYAVFGFYNAGQLADAVTREGDLDNQIEAWAAKSLHTEELAFGLDPDLSPEERCLLLTERISDALLNAFGELSEDGAEEYAERLYVRLFPEED